MIGFIKSQACKNMLLVIMVLGLMSMPLLMNRSEEFGGTDGQATKAVGEVRPGYVPWADSLWKPPGGEVESLLFALQAALGSGFVGYYFGYQRGKRKSGRNAE